MKLERIFESISVGVMIVDEDGDYVDFNDAYAHILPPFVKTTF
jgi:PAS domain-containing protein